MISAGICFGLSKLFATETYYVLSSDVPAKTQITKSLLTPQETAQGTAPQNAISMDDVQRGNVYSKYPLYQGDVASKSNVGAISNNFDGIPDTWGVTSVTIPADNAVDGILSKGDYFDIVTVGGDSGKYIATDILVLDVNSSSAGTADAATAKKTNSGAQLVYTIGLPQELIPTVHASLKNADETHFVRSPIATRYEARKIEGLDQPANSSNTELKDLFKGTDPTFSPIVRDKNSRPVNKENCNSGKVNPKNLCKINGFD